MAPGAMFGTILSFLAHCESYFIRGPHRAEVNEPRRKETKWRHEDASEMMFDYLVADNEIDISDVDCAFIKALIASQPKKCLYVCHSVGLTYNLMIYL